MTTREDEVGSDALRATRSVMDFVGLSDCATDDLLFHGHEPVVPTRHRLGCASAGALAAQAIGIREIWKARGGKPQSLSIDIGQASYPGLCTFLHIRQNGHALPFVRNWAGQGPNFFATRDDRRFYLLYTAAYVQHCLRLHRFLGATTSHESVAEKVAQWDANDLEEALAAQKLIGCIARTRDEWQAHPQGALLAQRPAVSVTRLQASAPEGFRPAARPLSGIRIVDMAHVLAGPITSRLLAEQGAEVIHVSAAHQPDGHLTDVDTGFGKRTAFIDLDNAEDRDRLRELIRGADVFTQSWRPGALARRGFSQAELVALRPGLIHVSLSCYGSEGPWGERGGYEPLGQAVSGLAIAEGSADQPQLVSTFTLNDYLTAYLAAAGVVSALLRRSREGGAYGVDASLTQTSMWVQELGRLPPALWPGAPGGIDALPAVPSKYLQKTATVFGELEHPRPIVQYGRTPAGWALPPVPTGAGLPRWS
ncbi:CoA transferase [Variovorax sp. J22P168]|uniref:CoA transferase n=1 Tax=Variovorax jilinensis TaxID=3053513 RepID=UPI002574CFC1|nr:CoA transferase [Variovorax sp. J22P168]MDM0014837.1 CoA transferase [Variovorax sp. J22P168]